MQDIRGRSINSDTRRPKIRIKSIAPILNLQNLTILLAPL